VEFDIDIREFLTYTLPRFLQAFSATAIVFIFAFVNVASVVGLVEVGYSLPQALFVVGRDFVACVVECIVAPVRWAMPSVAGAALFALAFVFFVRLFDGTLFGGSSREA